jgi:uridine kinase
LAALLIGVCGGTGAGKTTLARRIIDVVSEKIAVLIQQDHYYRDLGHLPFEERAHQNFDHPDSIDAPLLIEHLGLLQAGRAIDRPVYDFTRHVREQRVVRLYPRPAVVAEGTPTSASVSARPSR